MPENVALIVPTYDEANGIRNHLEYHASRFRSDELVVVDGGSTDGTRREVDRANADTTTVQLSPGNRARQLAEGIRVTSSEVLLFLHADTYLPKDFTLDQLREAEADWGWFDCRLDSEALRYRLLGFLISQRSGYFRSPTGDQAIWVYRELLENVGGMPRLPLMEDVALSQRLRKHQKGRRFRRPVTTSPRRWEENGFLDTVLTMWALKVAYFLGVPPSRLSRIYYGRTET